MLRRTLPVLAAAAAAVALLPGSAAAVPVSGAANGTSESLQAHLQLTVAGQPGHAGLVLNREPGGERRASLSLTLPPRPCAEQFCSQSPRSGWAEVSDEQITFARDLGSAAVDDVLITLSSFGYGGQGPTSTVETLTVSLTVTAIGAMSTDVEHGDRCGEGWPCQGTHVMSSRPATASLTGTGGVTASGEGQLWRGRSISAAVRPGDSEGPGEPPADGSGDAPSNGSGDAPADGSYPLPPADGSYPLPPADGSYPLPPAGGASS